MKSNILKTRLVTRIIPARGRFALLILVALVALAPGSRAALLFYDGFNYAAANTLGSSDSTAAWENAKSNITITEDSLNHVGLPGATGNRVNVNGGSSNLDGVRTKDGAWPSQTNGTLYVSFLLKLNGSGGIATSGTGTPIVNLCRTGSSSQQLLSLNLLNESGIKLGVLKYPSSSSPGAAAFFASGSGANLSADGATTYLIVAKYEWVADAANDIVTVWVNPGNLGGAEDGGNQVFTSGGADGTANVGRLFINRGPTLDIDELRIGTTWADVTPTGTPVIAAQPVITESFLAPGGFVLRGSNGPPAGIYQVLNATNVFHPLNLWTRIATNLFDPAGKFDCTNPVPLSATESYYRLQLGGVVPPAPSAPAITTEPAHRNVLIGQNATFNVVASGAAPLSYQWFFSNAPIANAMAAAYTVTNAQPTNAGGYFVVITNSIGAVTSVVANLSVVAAPAAGIPDGYATLNGGTTGGAGGPTVTVSTLAELEFYLDDEAGPCIILIQGTINLGGSNVRVRDNKTIIGLGTDATLVGDLKVDGNNNVIIRNLTFTNPNGTGDKDGLTLQDCRNVWVDHCTFVDCDDGSLDISHGADWITVSWCHFYYTNPAADHRFANLVGHSDSGSAEEEDTGKLHVTYHHNWWGQLVHERMPRVRFGRVHVYNNFYNSPGNNNCIRAARDCQILVENNYFDTVKNVWELYRTEGEDGKVFAAGNIEVNTTWSAGDDSKSIQISGTDLLSTDANGLNPPPYAYALDAAAGIPSSITNNAGAGKGPFAP
jgi:pectate lyase